MAQGLVIKEDSGAGFIPQENVCRVRFGFLFQNIEQAS